MASYNVKTVDPLRTNNQQRNRNVAKITPVTKPQKFSSQVNSEWRNRMQNFRNEMGGWGQQVRQNLGPDFQGGIGQHVRSLVQQALANRQAGVPTQPMRPDLGGVQDMVRGIPDRVGGLLPNRPQVPRDRIIQALRDRLSNFQIGM